VAKRNRNITAKVKERRKKEGRGLGRGKAYKPGLRIQDVSSIGLATRDKGWKTGRPHHFMSKLEWIYFYILEWSLIVTDILEQFPLDIEETLAIAKSLGIAHPTDPKTKEPTVMTTDFVVIVGSRTREVRYARTVKYIEKLSSIRVLEKFEIERVYWTYRDVDWGIVTELDVDLSLAANVEWVHFHRSAASVAPIKKILIRSIESYLAPRMLSGQLPLRQLTDDCDSALSIKPGSAMAVVRHLIANRRLEVNTSLLIQPEGHVPLIKKPTILQ
jgi:hypothetical protein